MYKLAEARDGRGLSCSEEGLALAGIPLLRRGKGCFAPRLQAEIEKLIGDAYDADFEPAPIMGGLQAVARALNAGETARAMVAALHLRLPALDRRGALRIAEAESALAKYNFNPDEPRDERGRWAKESEGGDSDDDQVRLLPGERIDELGDLLEWIANATPDDEQTIRREIKRLYYDVGDVHGGDALNRVAKFDGDEFGGVSIDPGLTHRRALLLIVPRSGITAVQREAINAARIRARSLDVDLLVSFF